MPSSLFVRRVRPAALATVAVLSLPALSSAAPVAVNDARSVPEDSVLHTDTTPVLGADFSPAADLLAGNWSYLDLLKNDQNGQTPDPYPVDGAGRDWRSLGFVPGTSVVGPWETSAMPIQGGGITAFPAAADLLRGAGTSPYSVTTYLFRKTFTADAAAAALTAWRLRYLADDAAVFYLNGQEIHRVRLDPANYFPPGELSTITSTNQNLGDESVRVNQSITLPAGLLKTGANVFAVELHNGGGANHSSTDVGLDAALLPDNGGGDAGFLFAADVFGNARPNSAVGDAVNTGGNPGGALRVSLTRGSFAFDTPAEVSGGWSRTFTLTSPATVSVKLDARLRMLGGLDAGDTGRVLLAVDGNRTGTNGNPWLEQIAGQGNAVTEVPSVWRTHTVQLSLAAGTHTITLGGEVTRPSDNTENADILLDNVSVTVPGIGGSVLANDTGGATSAVLAAGPSHGTLQLRANGNFSYTPAADYHGPDAFTYRASDGAATSAPATVSLTVTPMNDPPTGAADAYTAFRNTPLTVPVAAGVLGNDADIDSPAALLTAVLATPPANGSVTLNANGSFSYLAANNYLGPDNFSYQVSDGSALSQNVSVSLQVLSNGNLPPAAAADTYTVPRNGRLDVTLPAESTTTEDLIPFLATGWKYLDNGSDQGQAWRSANFNDSAWAVGAAELGYGDEDESTVVEDDAVPGSPTPESVARFATTYFRRGFLVDRADLITGLTLQFKHDDAGLVFVNGAEVFRTTNLPLAPEEIFSDFYSNSSRENTTETAELPVAALSPGANVIAAEVHQTTPDSSDLSFDLRLQATRRVYGGVLGNDSDPDFDNMTASLVSGPAHGTLTFQTDGTFAYQPVVGYTGADSFTYRAADPAGALSPATTVTLSVVNAGNQPPAAAADSYTLNEDTTLNRNAAQGVLANDTDGDGDPMTAVSVTPLTPAAAGALTLFSDGSLTFVPARDFTGAATFAYVARDSGGRDSAPVTVTLNVTNVNDAPIVVGDVYATDPNVPLTIPSPGVLGNDRDPDGDAITTVQASNPASGTLSLNANGGFTYTPAAGFAGTVTFAYRANDGMVNSGVATVTLKVNARPVANGDTFTTVEDTPLNAPAPGVLANDTDPENDPRSAVAVTQPAHGILALAANGSFLYTPTANYSGPDSFTYRVNDGVRDSLATATVNLTVTPVNDAPAAAPDTYTVAVDAVLEIPAAQGVLLNDSDAEGDALTVSAVALPAHGTLSLEADGAFTYTPEAGFRGLDNFTYRASDGVSNSAPVTVTLGVGQEFANVMLSEIMYRPLSQNSAEEYIELYNRGATPVDITGWRFSAGVDYLFPATVIPAGGHVVIAAEPAVFTATYGGVTALRGPWTGQLSNSGENIRLKRPDSAAPDGWAEVDEVVYADEGDWALRRAVNDGGENGWDWFAAHSGQGDSLELINPAMDNNNGQNWTKRDGIIGGPALSPGNAGNARLANIAPLITAVDHQPRVPGPADAVRVSAVLTDELSTGVTGRVFWRAWASSAQTTGAFQTAAMTAKDGVFTAVLPPQALDTVVEFFVEAADAIGQRRTWPAPTDGGSTQGANCLYQVDEDAWAARQPFYRLISTGAENFEFTPSRWNSNSNAAINVTFLSRQGADTEVRYQSGLRVRGAGSRGRTPRNWRLNFPGDNLWNDQKQANLNVWHSPMQHLGAQLMRAAGLPHEASTAVQVRLNRTNHANSSTAGSNASFGMYVHMQPIGDDSYAKESFPDDPDGNLYKKLRPHSNFMYRALPDGSPNITAYFGEDGNDPDGWGKQSNTSENNWNDLHQLMFVLTRPAPTLEQYQSVLDVDQWCRWFAFTCIVNDAETNLSNGSSDDFGLYSGVTDPRFKLLAHDYDTILNNGDTTTNPADGIYQVIVNGNNLTQHLSNGETIPAMIPFFQNPVINQRYRAQLAELLHTVFLPGNFDAFVDAVLGDWKTSSTQEMPASYRAALKTYLAARRVSILSQISGGAFTAATSLPVQNGYAFTNSATNTALSGTADALLTTRVLVNGVEVTLNNYNGGAAPGAWSAGPLVTLRPGLNRLLVQAIGANGAELERRTVTIWYDDSSTTAVASVSGNTTFTAAGGPWRVTADLTIDDETLSIEPGATVWLAPGVDITVSGGGRLLAGGTATAPVQLLREPGQSGLWGGIHLNGSSQESRLSFVDIDGAGASTVIRLTNTTGYFTGLRFFNTATQCFASTASSFVVENSVFPALTGAVTLEGSGIPAGGYAILRGNSFGAVTGAADAVRFTGGQRPGPILQVMDNTFLGSGDDLLELNSADAHIEGNVFLNAHQSAAGADSSNAIAVTGMCNLTIVRNLFHDMDHAVLNRDNGSHLLENNTVVNIHNTGSAAGSSASAFHYGEPGRAGATPGRNGVVLGNIVSGPALVFGDMTGITGTISAALNMLPTEPAAPVSGSGNLTTDPRLTAVTGVTAANIRQQFALLNDSPAPGTGPNGIDRGALVPAGASISGEPPVRTASTDAMLSIHGPGITAYRYSLDGGPFLTEVTSRVYPILLTNLTPGAHSVRVIGKNSAGVWQAEEDATVSRVWTVSPSASPVVLNELLAVNTNAFPNGAARPDYVELRNLTASPVNLHGWGLTDDAAAPGLFTFPENTTIPPNGYLLVFADDDDGTPGFHTGFGLSADGDQVILTNPDGVVADTIVFGAQIADFSLGRAGAAMEWTLNTPTPSALNVSTPTGNPLTLRINEWLGTNDIVITDDFLELYNPDPRPVALAGLRLTDEPLGSGDNHIIAPHSYIAAGGFTRFLADGEPEKGAHHLSWSLSRLREDLALLTADGRQIDKVISSSQLEDVSQGRYPDGAAAFAFFPLPTPGYSNTTPLATQRAVLDNLRLTEMMYNPSGSGAEFVELRNISASVSIDIGGVTFSNGIDFTFPSPTVLAPGQLIVITDVTQSAFLAQYPGAPHGGTYSGKLSNSGEKLRLEIGGYELGIHDFDFFDTWLPLTDGGGASMEIINAASPRQSWALQASWRASPPSPGTDGVFGIVAADDLATSLPESAVVEALVSYGPVNPATVALQWTRVSGPGTVTFGTPTSDTTTATFSAPGVYVLRVTATGGGGVSVNDTMTVTARETYASWSARLTGSGNPLINGADRDPDRDGLTNGIEYALGLNPLAASPEGLPVVAWDGDGLSVTYRRNLLSNAEWIVEASDNLQTWTSATVLESRLSGDAQVETWLARDTTSLARTRRYIRIRATFPN